MSTQQSAPREHARRLADELMARGAIGVALVGSVAAGTDHPDSDLDLLALVSEHRPHEYFTRGGRLVSLSWLTPDDARTSMYRPPDKVIFNVPGWRSAVPLADPEHVVRDLVEEANGWSWDPIAEECDARVADELTGLAEEVSKVVGLLGSGEPRGAAVNRSVLVLRLAGAMALRRRLLCPSENRLWDLVADAEGPQWAAAQDAALGLDPVATHRDGCLAALRLYGLGAERVRPLLDGRQAEVVEYARTVAERVVERQ